MTITRSFRLRWTYLAAQIPRFAPLMPVVFSVLLAGCTAGNFLQSAPSNNRGDGILERADASAPSNLMAEEKKSCPPCPSPRTLPEAFHAYLQCLRHGLPLRQDRPGAQLDQKEGSKNAPADKEPTKREEGKEKDKMEGKEGEKEKEKEEERDKEEWYSAHAQATVITQKHSRFPSPYSAFNSLPPVEPYVTSETTTVFLATKLWEGGELVFNPEVSGGKGFGAVVSGIANYPNEEITRVGVAEPTPYIARLLLRQTIGLGGEQEKIEDGANAIAGSRDISRLTVSVGKMAATDIADDNRYSHDPRNSFLPWAMVYNGAWDYPANVRGYTYGVAFDLNQKDWALRYGVFAVARFANSPQLDPNILKANGHILEWEKRYTLNDHPGKLRLWGYLNLAHMGKYTEAIAQMPVNPDITLTRAYRIKYGFGGNLEQELTKDLGAFARFGWNDGHTESWMFTEIDSTLVLGLVLKGRCWCRPQDQLGLAVAADGLSSPHRDYLAAGGLGFIIGDGRLNYGLEKTLEGFYNLELRKGISFALDLQGIDHPAYNKDRGPVLVVSGRLHIEF